MDETIETVCVELGQRLDGDSTSKFLRDFPHYIRIDVVEQLDEAVRTGLRVDVRKASALAEAALVIAQELKADFALGLAYRAKANALWLIGDCRSAVQLFSNAVALFEGIGLMNEAARTLSSSIQSHILLGEYEGAFAAADRARNIFGELGEAGRLARLELNVANIYHRQNKYSEALLSYERAYQQLAPFRDAEAIGVALHNMAVCLIALDNFSDALRTYQRVREFCEQHEMPLLVSQADYNIAYLYYLRGDYTRALSLLRTTRDSCHRNGDVYHAGLCELDESEIYLELGLITEAAEKSQHGFQHFEELGMQFEAARSLTNFAIATSMQGDSPRALKLFTQAKNILIHENNQAWQSLIDLYRAVILVKQNGFAEAKQLCLRAADSFRLTRMPSKQVLCLLVLSEVHLRTGRISEAASCCDEALSILRCLDVPILLFQAKFLRGKIFEASQQLEDAYSSYLEAQSTLETLRTSLQLEELKIGLMQNRLEVYGRLAQLCLNRPPSEESLTEAFSHIEAAKARALRDLIMEGTRDRGPELENGETDHLVFDGRRQLNWYYHRIEREQFSQDGVAPEVIDSLKLGAKEKERQLLRLLLETTDSGSVGKALQNSGATTLAKIHAALGPRAALLEYFAIGHKAHVAVVTTRGLSVIPLVDVSVLTRTMKMLDFQLSKFQLSRDYIHRFQRSLLGSTLSHLRNLYEYLITPIERFLDVQDLSIVPFGPLHSLPFHALFDGSRYLIERFTVCYEPSASIFVQMHEMHEPRTGPALILGIDDARTPFIRQEIEAVAATLSDSNVLLGSEATEHALRTYGPSSGLIHIASHGHFREDNPMFSSIKLADSYLNLLDLYRMNLPVDLLTLSGCVTGLNSVAEGDEILGLTRGLLYAGARSLLLSLWEVDDRSTSEFMKVFYESLNQRVRKGDAVRSAMIEIRKKYGHPYFWAPFKLIGNALG